MRIEEFLKAIPKVSPHVHLMGSIQAQTHARSVPTDDSHSSTTSAWSIESGQIPPEMASQFGDLAPG